MPITSKGNPGFARPIGGVKAEPVARLECLAGTPLGSFGDRKHFDSAPVQRTFDAEGEVLEHALTKSFLVRNEAIKSLFSSVRRLRDTPLRKNAKAIMSRCLDGRTTSEGDFAI
jgi:hypothetical protein